jgi:hemerythrin-like domain-containing protein
LFPCLVRLGIPEEGGPIGVMLAEHKLMRGIISQLERSFNDYLSTGSGLENALSLCMDYIFQLRQHVDKENGVLFPMGENISGEDDKKGRTNAMSMLKKSRSDMCSMINYHVLLKKSSLSRCPTHKVPVSSPLQKLRRLAHHSC